MASPVVAGIASLLKSKDPSLKPHQIEAILEMTAQDLGEKGYDLYLWSWTCRSCKSITV